MSCLHLSALETDAKVQPKSHYSRVFINASYLLFLGAIILAKLSVVPVRRGYWGSILGAPHTVPAKVTGKCGSITARIIPAPRGTGIVAAPVAKKLITLAGIDDCYTSTRGSTKTQGNFLKALFVAISNTYGYLTPDLWQEEILTKTPFERFSHVLSQKAKKH